MTEPPSFEVRNQIEHAADAALEAFWRALPHGASMIDGNHLLVLAHVPGLDPDAVVAGPVAADPGELLLILYGHLRGVAKSLGMDVQLLPVDQIGRE